MIASMRVRIVCYEEVDRWIMGKFALRMRDNLQQMGIDVDIAMTTDDTADINHHIVFGGYDGLVHANDTIMITHVDNNDKLELIKNQLKNSLGICMSKETQDFLCQMGADKNKLCYINPAHDGVMSIRKINVGICCRVQEDGRKREFFLDKLANTLDPAFFKFTIMGDSWEPQIRELQKRKFEVNYTNKFIYDEYVKLIPTLDYYLYMGMDEGQMGFIDALAAGVKTIVTSQGYHLDAPGGIVHPYQTYDELESIFLGLQNEKKMLVQSVSTWNWYDYTLKHVEIWKYMLGDKSVVSQFNDGLNSLLNQRNISIATDQSFIDARMKELKKNKRSHMYFEKTGKLKRAYAAEGLKGVLKLIKKKVSK
jgi:hypothetical protein